MRAKIAVVVVAVAVVVCASGVGAPTARAEPIELELTLSPGTVPILGAIPAGQSRAAISLGLPLNGKRVVIGIGGSHAMSEGVWLSTVAIPVELAWRASAARRGAITAELRLAFAGAWAQVSFEDQRLWQLRWTLGGLAGATWWASRGFGIGILGGVSGTRTIASSSSSGPPLFGTSVDIVSRLVLTMRL